MNKIFGSKTKISDIAARRETISIFLIAAFIVISLSSMFVSPRLYRNNIQEGDIALKDMYAPYDFVYFWGIDEEKTEKAKKDVLEKSAYYFKRDIALEEGVLASLNGLFDSFKEENLSDASLDEKVERMRSVAEIDLSEKGLKSVLSYSGLDEFQEKIFSMLDNMFVIGYIDEDSVKLGKEKNLEKVFVFSENSPDVIERPFKSFLNGKNIQETVHIYVSEAFPDDRNTQQAAEEIIGAYVFPNLHFDEEKTELEKENIIKNTKPVPKTWSVQKNELLIEKGMRVTAKNLAQLSQLRSVFRPGMQPTFLAGILLLLALLIIIGVIYSLFLTNPHFLKDVKSVAIMLINMLFMIILADFIIKSPQPTYFIPMASIGMVLTLLIGFNVAFLAVLLVSILIAFVSGGGVEILLVLLLGSTVGMLIVKDAGRRAKILWAGLMVGLAKFLAIACIGLINGMEGSFYIKEGVWVFASGIMSGFIVLGVLPVFEHLFKIPTNISLLELSDLNHPLLKRLAIEAPGTYHHSIMVGNLAEAACDSIGANSLMARVGAYYHDIGKMIKPEYFNENEMSSGSKHVNLAPSMSALIIAKHVKEGVDMAKKYKLNSAIVNFITQHHGNSLISYFYQKALEKAGNEGAVLKEENFRYPGPRPQTKENAIVLLADSVEASSRSLSDPTPSSIRNLVKKIINNKFIDEQLDECDLTLKDMHKIADSFVRVLMGIFHTRLDYPEEKKKDSNGAILNGNKGKLRKPKQKKRN